MAVALVGCGGGAGPKAAINSGVETHTYSQSRAHARSEQRAAIQSALNAALTAVRGLMLTSSDDDIAAAQDLVDAIGPAITAGTAVPADELGDFRAMLVGIQSDLNAREAGAMAHREEVRLTGELATANANINNLTSQLATANGNIATLTGQLATANGNIATLTGQLATANGEVNRLTGLLATANSNIAQLTADLTAEMGKVTQLTNDLTAERNKVTQLTNDLTAERNKVTQLTNDLETEKGKLQVAIARYMAAEGTQTLPDDPADDTDAQAQLRAAMERYMAAEGMQTLPDDPADDTDAQAQLRAAMMRYMAAEGEQMLDDTPEDDTDAQAQLRAAMMRYMAAEGEQMLDDTPEDDTDAQAQLRAAMMRYMAAEGEQMLDDTPEDDTDAQAQLRAAMMRYMAAEGEQMLDDTPEDDTPAQAQLRTAMNRYMAAEAVQVLDDTPDDDTPAQAQLRAALANASTAGNVVQMFAGASQARDLADAADKSADQALKDAQKYDGELGVLKVNGDSTMAMDNAQKVLDARDAAAKAVQDATAAKKQAQDLKTRAMALDDTVSGKAELLAAIEAAITAAEAQIKAATEVRDSTDLRTAVVAVTGCPDTAAGCTGDQKPKTAADKGKEVADLINEALTTTGQVPDAIDTFANITAVSETVNKAVPGPSDAQGMTWEQIGGSGLMDMRIASGTGTRVAKSKSMDDMKVSDLFTDAATVTIGTDDGTQIDSATATEDPTYKGIPGVLFCAGDCEVEGTGDARVLAGDWYFTPDGAMDTYLAGTGANAGTYSVEDPEDYVRYGYWLSITAADDDTTTINRYVDGPTAQTTAAVYGVDTAIDAFSGTSASYMGDAVGMSVAWETDTRGKEVSGSRASGHFDADVSLTMTFGTSPTLKGTISNFRGNGVDTSWSVSLIGPTGSDDASTIDTAAGTIAAASRTKGGGDEGTWTATVWGGDSTAGSEARPTGVYGAFDADFTNGAAAGVFATRKQ